MPWPVTRLCAFQTHQQPCKPLFLIDNSAGEVKCLADIPLLHLGSKVTVNYGSYWIIKVALLQFSPLTGNARESQSKTERDFQPFFSPTGFVSTRSLSRAAFSDLTFSFPLLKELQHPLVSQLLTSPLQSYQDKTFPSEDLHSNCLSMSKYSIYSNKLQSHGVSVPIQPCQLSLIKQ